MQLEIITTKPQNVRDVLDMRECELLVKDNHDDDVIV